MQSAWVQGNQIRIPDGWLVRELEAFEFTYTQTGVRYEAPPGTHDDGVMALALSLYGWDRVQGVAPLAAAPVTEDGVEVPVPQDWRATQSLSYVTTTVAGDFRSQLPEGGF